MPKTIIIPIHSFVDLITNSSTEIYVGATDKTIESIKELIESFLKFTNSSLKCKDVFEVQLQVTSYVGTAGEECTTYHDTYKMAKKYIETIVESGGSGNIDKSINITVNDKYKDDINIKQVVKSLEGLINSYVIEEKYDE